MLILRRRAGESFLIGEGVKVTVIATKDKEVQLAIDAPKDVKIARGELYAPDTIQHEKLSQITTSKRAQQRRNARETAEQAV